MNALIAVALVCAASVAAEDCTRETALDVITTPAGSAMECLMRAQASAASAGLPGGEGRYLKIACEPRARLAAAPNDQ